VKLGEPLTEVVRGKFKQRVTCTDPQVLNDTFAIRAGETGRITPTLYLRLHLNTPEFALKGNE